MNNNDKKKGWKDVKDHKFVSKSFDKKKILLRLDAQQLKEDKKILNHNCDIVKGK